MGVSKSVKFVVQSIETYPSKKFNIVSLLLNSVKAMCIKVNISIVNPVINYYHKMLKV